MVLLTKFDTTPRVNDYLYTLSDEGNAQPFVGQHGALDRRQSDNAHGRQNHQYSDDASGEDDHTATS